MCVKLIIASSKTNRHSLPVSEDICRAGCESMAFLCE
jgi:hypothetical protein